MLAEARQERAWSLRQAGRALGCSYETVRLWELRRRVPSVALARAIARAYDLPAEGVGRLMAEAVEGVGKSRE
jgi:transcriptional regulator with XRE-family HTH domain